MKMFIYYEDADSSQWVEVSGSSGGGSGASGSTGGGSGVTMETTDPLITNNGTLGELWLNTTSGELYACTDITTDANIWTNVGDGTGNITPNDPPENPTNTTIGDQSHNSSFDHTFTGGTDTDGNVTHYMVDEITGDASGNVVSNPMTVSLAEVPVGIPHQFTIPILTEDTTISFRVRSKDNSGSYSSGVTVTFVGSTFSATGGIIHTYSIGGINYKSHTFLTSGNFIMSDDYSIDILIVAGGAGGGGANETMQGFGGGGGAGGFRTLTEQSISSGSHTVEIGAGGSYNSNGDNSLFDDITSTGGGTGGQHGQGGIAGGSGGGGGGDVTTAGGSGNAGGYNPVEGYSGGTGYDPSPEGGAGGGGAGGVGHDGNSGGTAAGGVGAVNNYRTGFDIYYAGGGGGSTGRPDLSPGTYLTAVGGLGGGGAGGRQGTGTGSGWSAGGQSAIAGVSGTDNTGGGGGGGSPTGGLGGSGIVIIRYVS
jgi:hypothetical protein